MEEFVICHCCGTVSFDGWDNDYCVPTCDDCGGEQDYYFEDDGQPDEAQEWYDFDPDC